MGKVLSRLSWKEDSSEGAIMAHWLRYNLTKNIPENKTTKKQNCWDWVQLFNSVICSGKAYIHLWRKRMYISHRAGPNHFKLSFASSRTNTTLTEKNTFAQSRGWVRNSKWLPGKPNVLHLWVGFHFQVTSESHKRLAYAISRDSGSGVAWETLHF